MKDVAVSWEEVSYTYPPAIPGDSGVTALQDVTLELQSGECLAVMGALGAGKTTLGYTVNGLVPHATGGAFTGSVRVLGMDTRSSSVADLARYVGMAFEDPAAQLFTASLEDEVAFGLETLGFAPDETARRVDRALELVGLREFASRNPTQLSGGQRRRLTLAVALATMPQILVLDEPTGGMDAAGRVEVLTAIDRLRRKLGIAMLVSTQDAEMAARFADRVIMLRNGHVADIEETTSFFHRLAQADNGEIPIPQLARLARLIKQQHGLPPLETSRLIVEEMAEWLPPCRLHPDQRDKKSDQATTGDVLIAMQDVTFRYSEAPVLRQIDLEIREGEWVALVGNNGAGKSTLIRLWNGLLHPQMGKVWVAGQDTQQATVGELARTVGYLAQHPDYQLFAPTVWEDVAFGPRQQGIRGNALRDRVDEVISLLELTAYADRPPSTLSYGLRKKVALAGVLACHPRVLVLDEPTVGLDAAGTRGLMQILQALHREGTTIVLISHELELVARYAHRVVLLHQGQIVADGTPSEILGTPDRLRAAALAPLPVTALAERVTGKQVGLPLTPEEFVTRCDPLLERVEVER